MKLDLLADLIAMYVHVERNGNSICFEFAPSDTIVKVLAHDDHFEVRVLPSRNMRGLLQYPTGFSMPSMLSPAQTLRILMMTLMERTAHTSGHSKLGELVRAYGWAEREYVATNATALSVYFKSCWARSVLFPKLVDDTPWENRKGTQSAHGVTLVVRYAKRDIEIRIALLHNTNTVGVSSGNHTTSFQLDSVDPCMRRSPAGAQLKILKAVISLLYQSGVPCVCVVSDSPWLERDSDACEYVHKLVRKVAKKVPVRISGHYYYDRQELALNVCGNVFNIELAMDNVKAEAKAIAKRITTDPTYIKATADEDCL